VVGKLVIRLPLGVYGGIDDVTETTGLKQNLTTLRVIPRLQVRGHFMGPRPSSSSGVI
jgi:hypothetical protein